MNSTHRAGVGTLALFLLAVAFVLSVTEVPVAGRKPATPGARRAAVALRDNVSPFQKWGSRNFTIDNLNAAYDRTWYFTQNPEYNRKAEVLEALNRALVEYDAVDLFLLAHGNRFYEWVREIPAERRAKLRLVYNTGCENLDQHRMWLALGAKTYVGHPGVSMSPIFYVYFLRRWTSGWTVAEATREGNLRMRGVLGRVQFASAGILDADELYRSSEAAVFGDAGLTMGAAR